jgi:hypothetical protein
MSDHLRGQQERLSHLILSSAGRSLKGPEWPLLASRKLMELLESTAESERLRAISA